MTEKTNNIDLTQKQQSKDFLQFRKSCARYDLLVSVTDIFRKHFCQDLKNINDVCHECYCKRYNKKDKRKTKRYKLK